MKSISPSCVESLNSISISYVIQGSTCIVNAASERDMAVFAAGMIQVSRPITLLVFNFLWHIQLEDTFILLLYFWSLLSIEHYIWQAELKGRSFLCRTAASFVSALIGIIPKDPVLPKDFASNKESSGALIVVGSYVPKTTKQVSLSTNNTNFFVMFSMKQR